MLSVPLKSKAYLTCLTLRTFLSVWIRASEILDIVEGGQCAVIRAYFARGPHLQRFPRTAEYRKKCWLTGCPGSHTHPGTLPLLPFPPRSGSVQPGASHQFPLPKAHQFHFCPPMHAFDLCPAAPDPAVLAGPVYSIFLLTESRPATAFKPAQQLNEFFYVQLYVYKDMTEALSMKSSTSTTCLASLQQDK